MKYLKIFVMFKIKPGCVDQYLESMREMVHKSQAEEGCIAYTLNAVKDQPDVVALMEIWESEEALERHKNTEHFQTLLPGTHGFVESVISGDTLFEYEL